MNSNWHFGDGILMLAIVLPVAALWVFALVDLIRRDDLPGWQTAVWMLVILFIPIVGFILYFVFRPEQKTPRKQQPSDFYRKFHLDTRHRK